MKTLFILALLVASFPAQAAITVKDCEPQDWKDISDALSNMKIQAGAKFKGEVVGLLAEEMAPQCQVQQEVGGHAIPGNHFKLYELTSGSRTYKISVHTSIENPSDSGVSIIKLNAN